MPIHQERMIALVNAAAEFAEMHKLLREDCLECIDQAQRGESTTLEALGRIAYMLKSRTVSQDAVEIVAIEKAHFKRFAHRNRRAAARMRAKKDEGATAREAFAPVDQARAYTNEAARFDYDLSQEALDAQVARARRAAGLDPSDDPAAQQDKQ